jgi:acyl dehydratase
LEATSLETDIDLGVWPMTEERVKRYLDAVGDDSQAYFHYSLVPPLALAACTLGALLEKLSLPPGAIHSLQEIETVQPVTIGEEIRATARVERPRRRGSLKFITVSYGLDNSEGQRVQTGKTTVLVTSEA